MRSNILLGIAASSTAVAHQSLPTPQSKWTVGQTVQTDSGLVVGHAAPDVTSVSEYLGIPYAQPPVGDLRFAAPVRYASNDTIVASAFGDGCLIAPPSGSHGVTSNPANLTVAGTQVVEDGAESGVRTSEDCLTLNIWTMPQIGEASKAVMLWVYGGAFLNGWAGDPQYNGQSLAESEDVVVVSFNYRENIFGFPGAGTPNVGLLDQRLAVEWVRDNIAAFGGDPSRITLFGQSAGAASIDFYSYAWPSDPIIEGMILESGTTQVIPPLNATTSGARWDNVTSAVGCGTSTQSNSSAVLKCMRAANSTSIVSALTATPSFTPTIDNTIVFNSSEYVSRSLSGQFVRKPVLIGTNDNEEAIFRAGALLTGAPDQPPSTWEALNLMKFFCPCSMRANVSVYNQVPTWRYRWFGVFPNTNLTSFPDSGAYHGSEIPIIFKTTPAGKGIPNNTVEEQEVMAFMRGAWASFAKNPTSGLTSYGSGWPLYNPTNATLIRLAFNSTTPTGTNLVLPGMYDIACKTVFDANGNTNSTTSGSIPSATPKTSIGTVVKSQGLVVLFSAVMISLAWLL